VPHVVKRSVRRIAIIGGGLTGLAVALRRSLAGDRVTLFEAGERWGGQLHTVVESGYVVEQGAEGFVASSRAVPELAAEVGVAERIVGQLVERSFGWDGTSLVALGPGEAARFLGFQVPSRELGRGIRAFVLGMGELVAALVRGVSADVELRTATPVATVRARPGEVELELEGGARASFERVVVATSARVASGLLVSTVTAAGALYDAKTLSSVTVSLAYPRSAVAHPLDGTGFVVAESAQRDGLRACTFTSSKLPGRAPSDRALLRAFYRPLPVDAALTDEDWSRRSASALAGILGIEGPPEQSWVARWDRALPVHDERHAERVRAVEPTLQSLGIWLAGSAFHGSGIDAALRSAARVAEDLT
jgi:protoporphyrinogen/coproporphyrinogen III oxidase